MAAAWKTADRDRFIGWTAQQCSAFEFILAVALPQRGSLPAHATEFAVRSVLIVNFHDCSVRLCEPRTFCPLTPHLI